MASTQKFTAEADPGSVDATSAAARNVCRAVAFLNSLQRVADIAGVGCALLLRQQVCNLWGSVFVLRRAVMLPFLGFHRTAFVVGRWAAPCATAAMLSVGADVLFSLWLMAKGLELPPLDSPRGTRKRDLMIDCMPEMSLNAYLSAFDGVGEGASVHIIRSVVEAIPEIELAAVYAVLVNEHAFATRHPATSSSKAAELFTGRDIMAPAPVGLKSTPPRNAREQFIVTVNAALKAGRPLTSHDEILDATSARFGVRYASRRPSKAAGKDLVHDADIGGYRLARAGDKGVTQRTRHLYGLGYAIRRGLVLPDNVPQSDPR